jgi:hypothetical protein
MLEDRITLHLEIRREQANLAPIDKGGDLPIAANRLRISGATSPPPLRLASSGAGGAWPASPFHQFQQQFGQPVSAQSSEILGIEGFVSHALSLRSIRTGSSPCWPAMSAPAAGPTKLKQGRK